MFTESKKLDKELKRAVDWGDREDRDAATVRITAKGNTPEFIQKFIKDAADFGKWPENKILKYLNDVKKRAAKHYERNWNVIGKILQRYLGWSLPSAEAMQFIKKYKNPGPIYDVLAGTGYWSHVMSKSGLQAVPSDIAITAKSNIWGLKPQYGKVSRKNAVTLATKFANRGKPVNVLMSWIPGTLPVAALDLPKGSILFVVGENRYLPGPHDLFLNTSSWSVRDKHREGPRISRYQWLNAEDLLSTEAQANAYGDVSRDSLIIAYLKVTESDLKVESLVDNILTTYNPRTILHTAVR